MHISNLNIKVVNGIRRFYNIDSQVKSFKRKFVADEPLRLLKNVGCYYKSWSKLSYYKKEIV